MPVSIIKKTLKAGKKAQPASKLAIAIEATASMTDEQLKNEVVIPDAKNPQGGKPPGMTEEAMAIKLTYVYRMMVRGLDAREIAAQLKVSENQAYEYIARVKKDMCVDPSKLHTPSLIGDSLAVYNEIRGMALLVTSDPKATRKDKLWAMGVALQAEKDKNYFLTKIGVYVPSSTEAISRHVGHSTSLHFHHHSGDDEKAPMEAFMQQVAKELMQGRKQAQIIEQEP